MRKFLLYGVNGVVNTAISYGCYVLLLEVIDYRIAVAIAYALGVCVSYKLNGAAVFGMYGRFWMFAFVSVFLLSLNLLVTSFLVQVMHWWKELAQLPAILVVFVAGFLLNQRFVFNLARGGRSTSRRQRVQ